MTARSCARIFLFALLMSVATGCAQTEKRSEPIDTLIKNSKKVGAAIKEGTGTVVERLKEGAASASESISKTLKK